MGQNFSIAGLTNYSLKKFLDFLWQHFLLLISLFFLALGVAVCVRSDLGCSVISSAPYSFYLAGNRGFTPTLTLGMYTNLLNLLLVCCQIAVLRKQFQLVQLLQLIIGAVFGLLIDCCMKFTSIFEFNNFISKSSAMVMGCTIMAVGVAMEIRCASITMPGEGLPAALSKKTGKSFALMKIYVDICLVALAIVSMFFFFGKWEWHIVGIGTLFATLYCGYAVKFISRHLGWFDKLLGYTPDFKRYFYGLARYIQVKLKSNERL